MLNHLAQLARIARTHRRTSDEATPEPAHLSSWSRSALQALAQAGAMSGMFPPPPLPPVREPQDRR